MKEFIFTKNTKDDPENANIKLEIDKLLPEYDYVRLVLDTIYNRSYVLYKIINWQDSFYHASRYKYALVGFTENGKIKYVPTPIVFQYSISTMFKHTHSTALQLLTTQEFVEIMMGVPGFLGSVF